MSKDVLTFFFDNDNEIIFISIETNTLIYTMTNNGNMEKSRSHIV